MEPRYEEKTFENYFNTELDGKCSIYFPFGQVQEGSIGADSAAYSRSWLLWRRLGFPFLMNPKFSGVDLSDIASEMESLLGKEINNIPTMKTNLLFQYKRSEFITTPLGTEWHLWKQRYFRYDLYQKQHALLAHIESKFGTKVLVIYAAPAVQNINELVTLKKNKSIIKNTNFRRACDLTGHHRNTYVKSGTHSIACSEPKHLDNFDLLEKIKRHEASQFRNNVEFITSFASNIGEVTGKYEFIKDAWSERVSEINDNGLQRYKLLYAMLQMSVFRELTGVQWMVALS